MSTRTTLKRDLADLKQKVFELGENCIEISELYILNSESSSNKYEQKISEAYKNIKQSCIDLTDRCFMVLTLQQPLIKDLRFVIGTLQIVLNLEKITEQYTNTTSISHDINLTKTNHKETFIEIIKKINNLIKLSITYYLSLNISTEKEFINQISEITILHDLLYKQILEEIALTSGEKAQVEAQLLFAIRSMDKILDLCSNNFQQIKFIIIGQTN